MDGNLIGCVIPGKKLPAFVVRSLQEEGFNIAHTDTLGYYLKKVLDQNPSLIIAGSDSKISDFDDVLNSCKDIRKEFHVIHAAILIILPWGTRKFREVIHEYGIEDYIERPFTHEKLIGKVKSILERKRRINKQKLLRIGNLELDNEKRILKVKKRQSLLSLKEYQLLRYLLIGMGRIIFRDELLYHLWGNTNEEPIESRTLDMHIAKLRKKLRSEGDRIITEREEGYRFDF